MNPEALSRSPFSAQPHSSSATSPLGQNQPSPHPVQFADLPADILLNIFEQLPSYVDAAHLRGTCRTMNQLYKNYSTSIKHRSPSYSQFNCIQHALRLYSDQGGPANLHLPDYQLTDRDLYHMGSNQRRAEAVLNHLALHLQTPRSNIASPPRCYRRGVLPRDLPVYGGTNPCSSLSATHKRRITRSIYCIERLQLGTQEQLHTLIAGMRRREQTYVLEVAEWAYSFGFPGFVDPWKLVHIILAARRSLHGGHRGYCKPTSNRTPEQYWVMRTIAGSPVTWSVGYVYIY